MKNITTALKHQHSNGADSQRTVSLPTIMHIDSNAARIYKVASVTEHTLPISIYGAAATLMAHLPAWWEVPECEGIVHPLYLSLTGQAPLRPGLHLIPALPIQHLQRVNDNASDYIISVAELNGRRATR